MSSPCYLKSEKEKKDEINCILNYTLNLATEHDMNLT